VLDLAQLEQARYNAFQVQASFQGFSTTIPIVDWKSAINKFDDIWYGTGQVTLPDKFTTVTTKPFNIQNLIRDSIVDLMHLTAETIPTVQLDAIGGDDTAEEMAAYRAAIGSGYWVADRGERYIPELVMHLAGAGACFLPCTFDKSRSDYPFHEVWHPAGVYPKFRGKELTDIFYVEQVESKVAADQWPELLIANPKENEWVKVVTYLTREEFYKTAWPTGTGTSGTGGQGGTAAHIDYFRHDLGYVPVAWASLPSWKPGFFEGMFDQARGMLNAKNMIATLTLGYASQMVFGETVERGVMSKKKGPGGAYILDPNPAVAAGVTRLAPPNFSPELFQLDASLERGARGTLAFPAVRQGGGTLSNITGAGVDALQDERSSVVWSLQRLIGDVRTQALDICFALDQKFLDFPKDMVIPSKDHRTYTPSAQLATYRRGTGHVIYTGGGQSRLQQQVGDIQKLAAKTISRETAIGHDPNIADPKNELRKIAFEQAEDILTALVMGQQTTPESALAYAQALAKGKTRLEASELLVAAVPPPGAGMGAPGAEALPAPTQPGQAGAQNLALTRGAVPGGGAPSLAPNFRPAPMLASSRPPRR
jgi:hypothetical protein